MNLLFIEKSSLLLKSFTKRTGVKAEGTKLFLKLEKSFNGNLLQP